MGKNASEGIISLSLFLQSLPRAGDITFLPFFTHVRTFYLLLPLSPPTLSLSHAHTHSEYCSHSHSSISLSLDSGTRVRAWAELLSDPVESLWRLGGGAAGCVRVEWRGGGGQGGDCCVLVSICSLSVSSEMLLVKTNTRQTALSVLLLSIFSLISVPFASSLTLSPFLFPFFPFYSSLLSSPLLTCHLFPFLCPFSFSFSMPPPYLLNHTASPVLRESS